MLKMLCPNCHELIVSKLLAEIDETSCGHCNKTVPVRNVLISARGMTINRDELLKRIFRYKKLLAEVVDERTLVEQEGSFLESSRHSADQFIDTLEELMAGARDHYRLQFALTIPVRIRHDGKIQSGWLVNLSMVGGCIETENIYFLPSIGSIVSIEFSLPGRNAFFSLTGMIAWIKKSKEPADSEADIGVKFTDMTEKDQAGLWQIISSSVEDSLS